MAHFKTVCEAQLPIYNEEGDVENHESRTFFLLHWGLKVGTFTNSDQIEVHASYTVAICQEQETGEIYTFLPEEIRIIGTSEHN